jgi:hypothetical protein
MTDTQQAVGCIADFGEVRAAWFKDTEGNLLNLIEGALAMWSG